MSSQPAQLTDWVASGLLPVAAVDVGMVSPVEVSRDIRTKSRGEDKCANGRYRGMSVEGQALEDRFVTAIAELETLKGKLNSVAKVQRSIDRLRLLQSFMACHEQIMLPDGGSRNVLRAGLHGFAIYFKKDTNSAGTVEGASGGMCAGGCGESCEESGEDSSIFVTTLDTGRIC